MPSNEKVRMLLSWSDIEIYTQDVARKVADSKNHIHTVLAIGSGGLIPAAMIAYKIKQLYGEAPLIHSINAASYQAEEKADLIVAWPSGCEMAYLEQSSLLIVDDIDDSGETLCAFKEAFPGAPTATLIHKVTSLVRPDFFARMDHAGHRYWYVFPWEQ